MSVTDILVDILEYLISFASYILIKKIGSEIEGQCLVITWVTLVKMVWICENMRRIKRNSELRAQINKGKIRWIIWSLLIKIIWKSSM